MLTSNLIDRIKLPFRKDKELYSSLYHIIGLYPHNIYYYKLALTHKSLGADEKYVEGMMRGKRFKGKNSKKSVKSINNERLEFLGDAILDAISGDIVYHHFEGKREGFLTETRSKLVQRSTLNRLASEMGINKLIRLEKTQQRCHNFYLGGNAFEALVGALYLDRGYEACVHFMKKRILKEMIDLDKMASKEVNFKSKLIEWCQKNHITLDFRIVEEKKTENSSPVFVSCVVIEGIESSPSKGYTKKESEQNASRNALKRLKRDKGFLEKVFEAKTMRTKMEEHPVGEVPDTEPQDFIATGNKPRRKDCDKIVENAGDDYTEMTAANDDKRLSDDAAISSQDDSKTKTAEEKDEFDLSHISARPQSIDEIIAAAEEQAYNS